MKIILKLFRYTLVTLALLALAVIAYLYVEFNNFAPTDNFETTSSNLSYYYNSYIESRAAFRQQAQQLKLRYPHTRISSVQVPSSIDDSLTVDFCYIPAQDSSKIIVLSSGVHGVEAFVGSAMQLYFMRNYVTDEFQAKSGLLLIHSINPYGYKYTRRVSENNVDMNRNFDINNDLYTIQNTGYEKVSHVINPETPLSLTSWANKFYFIKALYTIASEGMAPLRQAILQGQYTQPACLYYGGSKAEPQVRGIQAEIERACSTYKTILSIDLHTGYGERGRMHLFPIAIDAEDRPNLENLFQGRQIDWPDSDDFYTVTGDFPIFVGQLNAGKRFFPMTFEFGTMNSQTTMGSLKSIHTMVMENQGHQYGYETQADSLAMKESMLEMYYPKSMSWRSHCIDEFTEVMNVTLPLFLNLPESK